MIVSGLRRVASTSRSRSWPADQREPAPDRSGASVPWNFSSGNGPEWHSRQSAEPAIEHDRPAAGRIAGRLRSERRRDGVADDFIGRSGSLRSRPEPADATARPTSHADAPGQPKVSAVIVRNQASA